MLVGSSTIYFKLPSRDHYSSVTQKRIRHLIKRYCNNFDIKLIFSSFKVGSLFSAKDPIPSSLRLCVVYKFSCAGFNACYVGETTRHFVTRVREHLATDRASHVYKHSEQSESCRNLCSANCFSIIDHATTSFKLKIKESLHIHWDKPTLNQQIKHANLKLHI